MSIYATPSLRPDDLVIPQGSDWGMEWPLFDADGSVLDTTGYSSRAQLRDRRSATGEPLHAFATALEGGTVSLTVTADESAAWDFRTGVYDVEVVSPDGHVTRVAQGRVRIDAEVTR